MYVPKRGDLSPLSKYMSYDIHWMKKTGVGGKCPELSIWVQLSDSIAAAQHLFEPLIAIKLKSSLTGV
jgi:hypothetical protein